MDICPAKKIFFFLLLVVVYSAGARSRPVFPLQLSENKRYLVDRQNQPFFIKEISAWGLIQAISEKEESAFLDSIRKKGFNTVLTCILNYHSKMTNDPYWQGISPLTEKWNFATPNPRYFEHVDLFLKMAAEKDILVMAVPAYLGYREGGGEGWWNEMKDSHNDSLKMKVFGEFLGNRYKSSDNLIWVAGGDNNGEGDLYPLVNNMLRGIKSKDTGHLWTGHFDTNLHTWWSTANPLYADLMDIDGLYVWTETVMQEEGPQYKAELEQYKKGRMILQLDQSYEHDVPHYADNENYQWIRRKMYDGLLSGCKGTSFSPGMADNQCYFFKNWKPLMNTTGMRQVAGCFSLFDSRAWHLLVPDEGHEIILSDRGVYGDINYICAAKAADNSSYIVYMPRGTTVYINTKKIAGKPLRAYWYNPRVGEAVKIGTIGISEKFGLAAPSEEDWVLVLDDDDLKLAAPGTWSD